MFLVYLSVFRCVSSYYVDDPEAGSREKRIIKRLEFSTLCWDWMKTKKLLTRRPMNWAAAIGRVKVMSSHQSKYRDSQPSNLQSKLPLFEIFRFLHRCLFLATKSFVSYFAFASARGVNNDTACCSSVVPRFMNKWTLLTQVKTAKDWKNS